MQKFLQQWTTHTHTHSFLQTSIDKCGMDAFAWCHCLTVKLCVVSLLDKGHSSWQHKALAISGWWMTQPTGQALTSLLFHRLSGVIYFFSQGLRQSFKSAQPVGQALLYLFAQWLVLVTHHVHTYTCAHTYTHRMLSVLISAAFRTAVECKKLTSDP